MTVLTIILVILIFSGLVIVHEFGHFIAARRAGVRVEEFGLGFPPRLLGRRRGATLYSLNAIPLGGFVKLYGEEGEGRTHPESLAAQPINTRAGIMVMGVIMNLLLAWVITMGLMLWNAPLFVGKTSDYPGARVSAQAVLLVGVDSGSPAMQAGLKPGDTIEKIDGTPVGDDTVVQRLISQKGGQPTLLTISSGHHRHVVQLTPKVKANGGAIGVEITKLQSVHIPLWEVPVVAAIEELRLAWKTLVYIGGFFVSLFAHLSPPAGVTGPIGITVLIHKAIGFGAVAIFELIVGISTSLAVFNILPIPALDGGRLAFLLVEKLAGRRVKTRVENGFHVAGFFLLLALVAIISSYDVYRITTHKLGF